MPRLPVPERMHSFWITCMDVYPCVYSNKFPLGIGSIINLRYLHFWVSLDFIYTPFRLSYLIHTDGILKVKVQASNFRWIHGLNTGYVWLCMYIYTYVDWRRFILCNCQAPISQTNLSPLIKRFFYEEGRVLIF